MNWYEPTDTERGEWEAWVLTRPKVIRSVIEKHEFAPWKLYRLTTSNHRVTIYAIDEPLDGASPTLKVHVTGEFNAVAFERTVFGIKPDDLVECDLPAPGELLGSADLTPEQVRKAAELILKNQS